MTDTPKHTRTPLDVISSTDHCVFSTDGCDPKLLALEALSGMSPTPDDEGSIKYTLREAGFTEEEIDGMWTQIAQQCFPETLRKTKPIPADGISLPVRKEEDHKTVFEVDPNTILDDQTSRKEQAKTEAYWVIRRYPEKKEMMFQYLMRSGFSEAEAGSIIYFNGERKTLADVRRARGALRTKEYTGPLKDEFLRSFNPYTLTDENDKPMPPFGSTIRSRITKEARYNPQYFDWILKSGSSMLSPEERDVFRKQNLTVILRAALKTNTVVRRLLSTVLSEALGHIPVSENPEKGSFVDTVIDALDLDFTKLDLGSVPRPSTETPEMDCFFSKESLRSEDDLAQQIRMTFGSSTARAPTKPVAEAVATVMTVPTPNKEEVFNRLIERGYTPDQASGIVSNLLAEAKHFDIPDSIADVMSERTTKKY